MLINVYHHQRHYLGHIKTVSAPEMSAQGKFTLVRLQAAIIKERLSGV